MKKSPVDDWTHGKSFISITGDWIGSAPIGVQDCETAVHNFGFIPILYIQFYIEVYFKRVYLNFVIYNKTFLLNFKKSYKCALVGKISSRR